MSPFRGREIVVNLSETSSLPLEQLDPEHAVTEIRRSPESTSTRITVRTDMDWPKVRDYEILSIIGSGGMGIVYKARHRTLHRAVALKTLRGAALADPEFRERFQVEAEAVARLQHPNIIQVFEVGTVEAKPGETHPTPFISLELVLGGSLERCTKRPQSPRYAAEIVEKLARAVQFAHRQGVIHRDLKPANVMLTLDGEPKIADFGLAKQLGAERDSGGRFLTQAGTVIGTPEYMAPEQANGDAPTPAVDIYALGVILYEMLTARVPFSAETPLQTIDLMRRQEPVAPRQLQPGLPRDIETICLKCLEKDPAKRYATAEALADDLRNFLDNRPIRARRLNGYERLARWCRRNPLVSASLAVVVGTFLIAFLLVSLSYWRADAARQEEAKQRQEAERKERAERWERYRASIAAASSALRLYNVEGARQNLEATPQEYRNWEWRHFCSQLDLSQHVMRADDTVVTGFGISPNGDRAILYGKNGFARIWDSIACKEIRTIQNTPELFGSVMSNNGRLFAYCAKDNTVTIRNVDTNTIICELRGHSMKPHVVQFTAGDSRILTASEDGTVRLWDVVTGEAVCILRPFKTFPKSARISPDGHRIVVANEDRTDVRLLDLETGSEIARLSGHDRGLEGVCFTRLGDRFVTGEGFPSNNLRLWNSKTGQLIAVLGRHGNMVAKTAFNCDGTRFASASLDQTVRLWDGVTGKSVATLKGHYGRVVSLGFSPDGKQLVSGSLDHTARIWDAENGAPLTVLIGHTNFVREVAFTSNGKHVVTASTDSTIRIWDPQAMENDGILRGHRSFVYSVVYFRDGKRIASAGWDGTVRIWNVATGKQTAIFDHGSNSIVTSVAIHPEGRILASRVRGGTYLWDIQTGRELHRWSSPSDDWKDSRVAFNPSGDLLATGSRSVVQLWDVATFKEVAAFNGHKDDVRDVVFSPDGKLLASSGDDKDGTIRIWDVRSKKPLRVLEADKDGVYTLAFSPDGKILASASNDGAARLWDTESWRQTAIMTHGTSVFGLAFSPDQSRLACACADNSIRLWDVATHLSVADLRGHTDYAHAIVFSPDGTKLISASGDFTLRIWDTVRAQDRTGEP